MNLVLLFFVLFLKLYDMSVLLCSPFISQIDKGNEKEKHLKMNSFSEFSPSQFLYTNV